MSISSLDSAWSERLGRLEELLKRPDLVIQISKHQGMPYALFPYPPTAEREVRREVRLLGTVGVGRGPLAIALGEPSTWWG